jgi:hypothetical protein
LCSLSLSLTLTLHHIYCTPLLLPRHNLHSNTPAYFWCRLLARLSPFASLSFGLFDSRSSRYVVVSRLSSPCFCSLSLSLSLTLCGALTLFVCCILLVIERRSSLQIVVGWVASVFFDRSRSPSTASTVVSPSPSQSPPPSPEQGSVSEDKLARLLALSAFPSHDGAPDRSSSSSSSADSSPEPSTSPDNDHDGVTEASCSEEEEEEANQSRLRKRPARANSKAKSKNAIKSTNP